MREVIEIIQCVPIGMHSPQPESFFTNDRTQAQEQFATS